jgi:hypothetical protein
MKIGKIWLVFFYIKYKIVSILIFLFSKAPFSC